MLCVKVEKATHELLDLVSCTGQEEEVVVATDDGEGQLVSGQVTPISMYSARSRRPSVAELNVRPGEKAEMRARQKREDLKQEAAFVLNHFQQRTLEALLRSTRVTLESLKRRVSSPSALSYGESAEDRKRDLRPAFEVKVVLSVPNIALRPGLDEIQAGLNEMVQCVIGVHREVYMWGQSRGDDTTTVIGGASSMVASRSQLAATSHLLGAASTVLAVSSHSKKPPLRSFYKAISEHKEIAKIVSLLTSTVSSAKQLVMQRLASFDQYKEVWTGEREDHMKTFMATNPVLSEFEAEMRRYEALEASVKEEIGVLPTGAFALKTGEIWAGRQWLGAARY